MRRLYFDDSIFQNWSTPVPLKFKESRTIQCIEICLMHLVHHLHLSSAKALRSCILGYNIRKTSRVRQSPENLVNHILQKGKTVHSDPVSPTGTHFLRFILQLFTLLANRRLLIDSDRWSTVGAMFTNMSVFESPPNESLSSCVSFEFR